VRVKKSTGGAEYRREKGPKVKRRRGPAGHFRSPRKSCQSTRKGLESKREEKESDTMGKDSLKLIA